MYIKRIQLKNIRGFEELDIDLKRDDGTYAGWTVFAGQNGAGKTTLMQAIAKAIYADDLGASASAHWLRHGAERCEIHLEFVPGTEDSEAPPEEQVNTFAYGFMGNGRFKNENSPADHPITHYEKGWLLLGYGPFRRISGEAAEMQGSKVTKAQQRVVTLFNEGAALTEAIKWLQNLNYQSLESDSQEAERAKKLEQVALQLLNDQLLPNGTSVTRVSSKGLHLNIAGQDFIQDQFSDGYRSVIALVLDMLRHIHDAYGEINFDKQGPHCQIHNEAVVLIDEIDAHLHISWQKEIGFWLKSRFPNIQFLVTSHSPFICQAADSKGLIRLAAPQEKQTAKHLEANEFHTVVNGSADEATLTALFGLEYSHSNKSEAMREELAQIEGKMIMNQVSQAELTKREELIEQMPKDGANEISRLLKSSQGR